MSNKDIYIRKSDEFQTPGQNNHSQIQSQRTPNMSKESIDNQQKIPFISILTFDENYSYKGDFLSSPLSKEACLRLGIVQKQLLTKNLTDFQQEHVPEEFRNDPDLYHNIRLENYEYNRQQLLKSVIEERDFLMNNPKLRRTLSVSQSKKQLYKFPRYWGFKGQGGIDKITQQEVIYLKRYDFRLMISYILKRFKIQMVIRPIGPQMKQFDTITIQQFASDLKQKEKEQRIREMKLMNEQRKLRESKESENDRLAQLIRNQNKMREQEEKRQKELEDLRNKRNVQLEIIEEVQLKQLFDDQKIKKQSKYRKAMSEKKKEKYDQLQQSYLVLRQQRDNDNIERYLQREDQIERKRQEKQQMHEQMLHLKRYKQEEKQRRVNELKLMRQKEKQDYQEYLRQKQQNDSIRIDNLYQDRRELINQKLRDHSKKMQQASYNFLICQIQCNLDDAEYQRHQKNTDVLNKIKQSAQEAEDRKNQWLMEQKKQLIYERLREDDAREKIERLQRANAYKQQQYYDRDDSRENSQSFYLDPSHKSPSKHVIYSRMDSASGKKRMIKKETRNFRSYTYTPVGEIAENIETSKRNIPQKEFIIKQSQSGFNQPMSRAYIHISSHQGQDDNIESGKSSQHIRSAKIQEHNQNQLKNPSNQNVQNQVGGLDFFQQRYPPQRNPEEFCDLNQSKPQNGEQTKNTQDSKTNNQPRGIIINNQSTKNENENENEQINNDFNNSGNNGTCGNLQNEGNTDIGNTNNKNSWKNGRFSGDSNVDNTINNVVSIQINQNQNDQSRKLGDDSKKQTDYFGRDQQKKQNEPTQREVFDPKKAYQNNQQLIGQPLKKRAYKDRSGNQLNLHVDVGFIQKLI